MAVSTDPNTSSALQSLFVGPLLWRRRAALHIRAEEERPCDPEPAADPRRNGDHEDERSQPWPWVGLLNQVLEDLWWASTSSDGLS